jgi:hypothetical protein
MSTKSDRKKIIKRGWNRKTNSIIKIILTKKIIIKIMRTKNELWKRRRMKLKSKPILQIILYKKNSN